MRPGSCLQANVASVHPTQHGLKCVCLLESTCRTKSSIICITAIDSALRLMTSSSLRQTKHRGSCYHAAFSVSETCKSNSIWAYAGGREHTFQSINTKINRSLYRWDMLQLETAYWRHKDNPVSMSTRQATLSSSFSNEDQSTDERRLEVSTRITSAGSHFANPNCPDSQKTFINP